MPRTSQVGFHPLSRRDILTGIGALAASALLPKGNLWSQARNGGPGPIDLHHHFQSPGWNKLSAQTRNRPEERNNTPARTIEAMDRAGVATAVVSCTERGVWFGDDFEQERPQAIRLAREVNEFGAKMMSDYKGRFGLFAVLPLPDID